MSSSRWIPFVGLALASCAAPAQDMRHLLWPDQLHLTYETGENTLEGRRNWDVDRQAVLIGLSWDISSRNQGLSAEDLRMLVMELRQEARPVAAPVVASAPVEAVEPPLAVPVEPTPEPEPEVVVAETPPPEPVPEPAPAEPVAEVVPEVVEEPAPEAPVEVQPVVEEVAEPVAPVTQEILAPVEPASLQTPAPIVEAEGRALFGVLLVSAVGVLVVALAIRLLPNLRAARNG